MIKIHAMEKWRRVHLGMSELYGILSAAAAVEALIPRVGILVAA